MTTEGRGQGAQDRTLDAAAARRMHAKKLILQGIPTSAVASRLGISASSVKKWCAAWRRAGELA